MAFTSASSSTEKETSFLPETDHPTHNDHFILPSLSKAISHSTQEDDEANKGFLTDTPEIRRVRWKVDRILVPMLAMMYLCSYLDRSNIGNAKVAGLEKDLNLNPDDFNTALSTFYVGYVLGQVPSSMMLKIFGPRKWIPLVMFTWGSVMMSMAAIKTATHLFVTRFFLGLAESGYAPGPVFILSMWYTRQEQAFRVGLFFSASAVAGAFGGLLAYGIAHLDGVHGLGGWQWIFLLEGIPTMIVCIIALCILPDFPATSKFLTPAEKELTIQRLRVDAGPATEKDFSWIQFRAAFLDWKVHLMMMITFLHSATFASLGHFIPTIVLGFNYDPITSQIMTVPVYAVAAFFTLLAAYSSDKRKERGYHGIITMTAAAVGYLLLILTRHASIAARYASLVLCTAGVYAFTPSLLSWPSVNVGGETKRAVSIALVISFGQVGAAVGGQLYRHDDAPLFERGHLISCGLSVLDVLLIILLKVLLMRENKRREQLSAEDFERESTGRDLGDRHPAFRYYT